MSFHQLIRRQQTAEAKLALREEIRAIIDHVRFDRTIDAGPFFNRPNEVNNPGYYDRIGGEDQYISLSIMIEKADELTPQQRRYTRAMDFLDDVRRMRENTIAYYGDRLDRRTRQRTTEYADMIYMYTKRRLQNLAQREIGRPRYVTEVFAIRLPEDDWNPQLEPPTDELAHYLRRIIDEGKL